MLFSPESAVLWYRSYEKFRLSSDWFSPGRNLS